MWVLGGAGVVNVRCMRGLQRVRAQYSLTKSPHEYDSIKTQSV